MYVILCVALTWWMTCVGGQRAPCYQCEMYKDSHPHSHPYSAVRAHCVYPCGCGTVPQCPAGVPVIRDGCGCCWQCARKSGEECDGVTLCDASRGLTCHYNTTADAKGTCKEMITSTCRVNSRTYENGQTFTMDCRTQCTCQNGTYGCVSLCPGENIPPSSQCRHPHLVSVPGQCCREWMCDAAPGKAVGPPICARESGQWSACSVQTCGVGVSVRWSTENGNCQVLNQTRLCQLRPCTRETIPPYYQYHSNAKPLSRKHHIRRGHTCKATQRALRAVRLQVGWCVSERRYRPKQCGACVDRCCTVYSSTTITVAFLCPLHSNTDLLAGRRSHSQDDLFAKSRVDYQETIVTTPTPSVYDMMDEGQPVLDEHLINHHQEPLVRQHQDQYERDQQHPLVEEAFLNNYPDYSSNSVNNDHGSLRSHDPEHRQEKKKKRKEELVYLVAYDNENLTIDDESAYDRIRKDNYKIVHHRVQWILRCKCRHTCENNNTQDPTKSSRPTSTKPISHGT